MEFGIYFLVPIELHTYKIKLYINDIWYIFSSIELHTYKI